jgi:hypothetical protein
MKRRRHTPEHIIRKLAEGEKLLNGGQPIAEVARHLEITEQTRCAASTLYSAENLLLVGDMGTSFREPHARIVDVNNSWGTPGSTAGDSRPPDIAPRSVRIHSPVLTA